jgi:hypothetical protein
MSRIDDLGDKNQYLPDILDEYQTVLDQAKGHIQLSGKEIGLANVEQASWLAYYDERRAELRTLDKWLESEVNRVRGRLFKAITEHNARDLSDRAKEKYIDTEPAYQNMYAVYLEIHETYEQFIAIVDAFKARGYALNNLTRLKVAQVDNVEL